MDAKVAEALARALGHAPPFGDEELAALDAAVYVAGARDLSALSSSPRIRELHLHACDTPTLEVLAHLPRLERLRVTCSTVADIKALANCRALTALELAFDLIEDARPVQSLPNLRHLLIVGNPLDEHSYHEVLAPLRDARGSDRAGMVVEMSMQYDWSINRQLRDAGIDAVFDVYDGRSYLVKPGPSSALGEDAEVLAASSSFVADSLTLWEIQGESLEWLHDKLFTSRVPRVPFPRERHYIVGNARDADEWIDRSSLPEDTRKALRLLVQRFPGVQYARLSQARIDEWQSKNGTALPAWFTDILLVLADVSPGRFGSVRFDGFDHWSNATDFLDRAWFQLGLTTPMGGYRKVLDQNGFVTVGIWLETVRSNLAINLRDPSDTRIYEFDIEDAGESGLNQAPRVVFDSYASMLAHVRSIQLDGATSKAPAERIIEASPAAKS